jgi:FkbM family methyltransferase
MNRRSEEQVVLQPSSALRALRSVTSLWPFRGAPAIVSHLFGAAVRPSRGSWVVSPALGLCPELELDLSSHWHRELYLFPRTYGRFYLRRQLAAYLPTVLREGSVFFDVGANVGIFTQCAAKLVGSTGRVIAFEPEPTTFASLSRSVRRNGLSNVTCVQAAASDHAGSATFHRASDGTANSLVGEAGHRARRYVEEMTVPVVTLDGYVAETKLDAARIALVKVDVEGEEPRTVAGMRDTLAAGRPAIWCEVRGPRGSTRAPGTVTAVAALLADLGYQPNRWNGAPTPVDVKDVLGREDILFLPG